MARTARRRARWLTRPSRPHRRLVEAGEAELPPWVTVSGERMAHLRRVAELMDGWAEALDVPEEDRSRWRAAAFLHDALKDVEAAELRIWAGSEWPEPVLHGPACAGRLREEGVKDEEVLLAIAYHSIGHPSLTELGEFLYLADYLEPGRRERGTRRANLRERLPNEREDVLIEVVALRISHLLDSRTPILQPSIQFWNRLVEEYEAD